MLKKLKQIDWSCRLKSKAFIFAIISLLLLIALSLGVSPQIIQNLEEDIVSIIGSVTLIVGSIGSLVGIIYSYENKWGEICLKL